MKKKYNLTLHITPELKTFVAVTARPTWRYEGHYRGSALELEATKFGWHNISHVLVEKDLTKKQALQYRRELIESSGCVSLNQRMALNEPNLLKPIQMKEKEKQISLMASNANGVKLSLTFDNRYQSKSGYPVVVRVYHQRKWAYVPTGFNMSANDFKKCGGETLSALESKFNTVKEWCTKSVSDGTFSLKGAKECVKAQTATSTLAELVEFKKQTITSRGTMLNYEYTKKIIRSVFSDGLPIQDVNAESLKKIIDSLKKHGKSDATVNIVLSIIKASLNYAIYKGLFDDKQYPFKKNVWECDKITLPKSPKRSDRYITIDEMRNIWNVFLDTGDKWIGLFLFSYLTGGMNVADMIGMRFNREWVVNKTIRWTRKKTEHKTANTIVIPVSTHIDKLFERMGIEQKEGEPLFKFLDGDYTVKKNQASAMVKHSLKKHGFNITMTYARHSFATIATKSKMPASMVEQSMGHSLSGVSSHYIGSWDIDEMRPYFEKLL